MRSTALLTVILLAVASAPTPALARPTITVGDTVPFSADDLANAVTIRTDSTSQVRVQRDGDTLIITVGDQVRSVDVIGIDDPHDMARIAALVIVSLDAPAAQGLIAPPAPQGPSTTGSIAPLAPIPPLPPLAPTPPTPPLRTTPTEGPPGAMGVTSLFGSNAPLPPPKDWTLRFSLGYEKTEWIDTTPVMGTISRRLGPSAHFVLGVGVDRSSIWSGESYNRIDVSAIPMRAGVELRRRWFAIEGGIAATRWSYDPCIGSAVVATGGYANARVYLFALGAMQNRVFVEGGIRHVTTAGCTNEMGDSLENRDTTTQGSFGLEIPL